MKLMKKLKDSTWAAGLQAITCPAEGCGRWLTRRHISDRKIGIWMQDSWYCSGKCLRVAAYELVSHLLAPTTVKANRMTRMPVGLMLVRSGFLSSDDHRSAVAEQKETGEELGDLLVRRDLVTEKQLTAVRAMQWSCPVFSASKAVSQVKIQIPQTLIKSHSMTPLHYSDSNNQLLVGFVQGIDYRPLYAIEQMTGCKTQPCFVTAGDFQTQMQIREQTPDASSSELMFDGVQTAAEMARTLANYSQHLKADDAAISKCGDFVWARLASGANATDLLFRVA